MKMLIKSIDKQLNYYRQKDYSLSEKHLKHLEECLEGEKEMNAILTEEKEMLKTKLSHNSKSMPCCGCAALDECQECWEDDHHPPCYQS